jgi:hypothetical protein
MGALDHPVGEADRPLFPDNESGEASTAQTIQTRLMLKY